MISLYRGKYFFLVIVYSIKEKKNNNVESIKVLAQIITTMTLIKRTFIILLFEEHFYRTKKTETVSTVTAN